MHIRPPPHAVGWAAGKAEPQEHPGDLAWGPLQAAGVPQDPSSTPPQGCASDGMQRPGPGTQTGCAAVGRMMPGAPSRPEGPLPRGCRPAGTPGGTSLSPRAPQLPRGFWSDRTEHRASHKQAGASDAPAAPEAPTAAPEAPGSDHCKRWRLGAGQPGHAQGGRPVLAEPGPTPQRPPLGPEQGHAQGPGRLRQLHSSRTAWRNQQTRRQPEFKPNVQAFQLWTPRQGSARPLCTPFSCDGLIAWSPPRSTRTLL